jgi:hypothetical protein
MKPNFDIPVHDGSKFDWRGGSGYAEASDFGRSVWCRRVWSDACDVGFVVVSPRTGVKKLFTLVREERDGEGEVTSWKFVECGGDVCITVFND